MISRMVYMLFAPFQIEVTGRTKPVLIQFIRAGQRITTALDPGSVPVETSDLGHANQAIGLSTTSISVQVCTSAHLVMYGKRLANVSRRLKILRPMPKNKRAEPMWLGRYMPDESRSPVILQPGLWTGKNISGPPPGRSRFHSGAQPCRSESSQTVSFSRREV